MGGLGLRAPYQRLPEISDRVHRGGGYPNRLHDRGNGRLLRELLRQYLYVVRRLFVSASTSPMASSPSMSTPSSSSRCQTSFCLDVKKR